MVVNRENKFIFVHVFRTGGSSIEQALGGSNTQKKHASLESIPDWQDYFSFGIVRNPWDRLVSSFMYMKTRKRSLKTFNEYVQQFTVGNLRTSKQYAQYNVVKNCSYIGRFEHLQEDFNTACDLIGIPNKILPQVWKTKHRLYKTYFTKEHINIVENAFCGDIEMFGFDFDGTATKHIGKLK